MIAALVALVVASAGVQECGVYGVSGPGRGVVVWWGAESADLAPVGAGACTRSVWVDPLGVEVRADR